jgi:hypothetical protein
MTMLLLIAMPNFLKFWANVHSFDIVRTYGKPLLELSALALSIVNGLMLLNFYLRDRARLAAHPIHPEIYQWWFRRPAGNFDGKPTRRYGFIAYIAIQNSGLRKTQLTSWRLSIKTRLGRWNELKPINMPEPSSEIGNHVKLYPVLGQRGVNFEGGTLVDSGCSTSGMVYYVYECYGGEGWDPEIVNQQITGKFGISDGFNGRARCEVRFCLKPLEYIRSFAPGIETIDENKGKQNENPDGDQLSHPKANGISGEICP